MGRKTETRKLSRGRAQCWFWSLLYPEQCFTDEELKKSPRVLTSRASLRQTHISRGNLNSPLDPRKPKGRTPPCQAVLPCLALWIFTPFPSNIYGVISTEGGSSLQDPPAWHVT